MMVYTLARNCLGKLGIDSIFDHVVLGGPEFRYRENGEDPKEILVVSRFPSYIQDLPFTAPGPTGVIRTYVTFPDLTDLTIREVEQDKPEYKDNQGFALMDRPQRIFRLYQGFAIEEMSRRVRDIDFGDLAARWLEGEDNPGREFEGTSLALLDRMIA